MLKRLMMCVLAGLMIMLVGCNVNTVKEATQDETIRNTSFPAGNTLEQSQEEKESEVESSKAQEETKTEAEAKSTENQVNTAIKPKTENNTSSTLPKQQEMPKQTNQEKPKPKQETPNEPTVTPKPVENQAEKPTEKQTTETTQAPKPAFDVNTYVNYAKEYAVSIGLTLDSTATECWDNPISANPNKTGIKSDIQGRLNRYKNIEGFTSVWIWAEKITDTDYNIYIGYA